MTSNLDELDVINHVRCVPLSEFHTQLTKLKHSWPIKYNTIAGWLMGLKSSYLNDKVRSTENNLTGTKAAGECPVPAGSVQNNHNL